MAPARARTRAGRGSSARGIFTADQCAVGVDDTAAPDVQRSRRPCGVFPAVRHVLLPVDLLAKSAVAVGADAGCSAIRDVMWRGMLLERILHFWHAFILVVFLLFGSLS